MASIKLMFPAEPQAMKPKINLPTAAAITRRCVTELPAGMVAILTRTRILALLTPALLCGCQSPHPVPATPVAVESLPSGKRIIDAVVHDNAMNLLHDLLGDEKNVSKVLIIKHASPAVKQLIKNISETAGVRVKTLESFVQKDAAPNWERLGLPPGEKAVRQAMSKTKEHELLHTSGKEFEFLLLLTQAEGLGYGTHLARIAAENAPDPGRADQLFIISKELDRLHADTLALLRAHR